MENKDGFTLETERLFFRQHIAAYMDAYCAMEMEPDAHRYVGGCPRTRVEPEKRFNGSFKPLTGRLSIWATVYKPANKYIGRCGIYPHFNQKGESTTGEASLGLYINKEYRRMGLATEAGRAFVRLGFDKLKRNKIVTMVPVGNDASRWGC